MGKGKNIAIGAAVAGVAGYVAGILTAPKSGKETRQDIKNTAIKAKREAEKKLKELHGQLDSLLKEGKAMAAKLGGKTKEDWEKLAATAMASKDKVKAVLSSIHEGGTDDKDLQKAIKDANNAVQSLKDYIAKNAKAKS
jgi:gas vesicle protein